MQVSHFNIEDIIDNNFTKLGVAGGIENKIILQLPTGIELGNLFIISII